LRKRPIDGAGLYPNSDLHLAIWNDSFWVHLIVGSPSGNDRYSRTATNSGDGFGSSP